MKPVEWLAPLGLFVAVLLTWQLVVTGLAVPEFLVPAPTDVLAAMGRHGGALLVGTRTTALESLAGFGASAVIGTAFAFLMTRSRWLEQSLLPYAMFLQTVPVVAVAPLFVLWFGIGFGSVAASSFIVAVFPVVNAAAAGLRAVEPDHRALFVLYKASRWQTFWRLEAPSSAPFLAAGLRSASGLAVIGAVVGEFVSGHAEGNAGLGTIVLSANRQMQTSLMFAAVLCCSATGLAMFAAVSLGARAFLGRWHASTR